MEVKPKCNMPYFKIELLVIISGPDVDDIIS